MERKEGRVGEVESPLPLKRDSRLRRLRAALAVGDGAGANSGIMMDGNKRKVTFIILRILPLNYADVGYSFKK